jgi:HlyD family secretion protein
VTSAQLKGIKVGQKAKVFADYGDGQKKEYEGVVSWISSRSEFTPKTILTDDDRADLVYAVKIAIKNDGYAKIGMYGEVKF